MGHFVYLLFKFLLYKESVTFKRMKILHYFTLRKRRKKPNLSEFTQVLCGLLSLLPTYLYAKIKHIGAKLTVISFSAIFWSQHSMPSIPS